jgi:hypothetical protein
MLNNLALASDGVCAPANGALSSPTVNGADVLGKAHCRFYQKNLSDDAIARYIRTRIMDTASPARPCGSGCFPDAPPVRTVQIGDFCFASTDARKSGQICAITNRTCGSWLRDHILMSDKQYYHFFCAAHKNAGKRRGATQSVRGTACLRKYLPRFRMMS